MSRFSGTDGRTARAAPSPLDPPLEARGGGIGTLDEAVERVLQDQARLTKRAPVARMLHREFGRFPGGQRPELRRKMFSKLERMAADVDIGDAVLHIIEEVIEDSADAKNPAAYFAASVMRRIQDRGVLVERCKRRVANMPQLPG